jgi:hypothetical protein
MAIHDYVIDNQSAPAFRSDLNSALQAIVTQNSSATAPTTTYANMIWYDTAANQLKKRNEANSAWIILGTIDEALGTFTPSGQRALASQAQAEAGSDNTTVMTPLRTAQAIAALAPTPTTAQILAANAGAAARDVGTYIIAWNTTATAVASGGTIAGSSLRYQSSLTAGQNPFETRASSSSTFSTTGNTALTGTWRALTHGGGRITTGTGRSTSYEWPAAIWLRTA